MTLLDLTWPDLWAGLFVPLTRLVLFMSCGLLAANLLEALHWTRFMARLAFPLARMGHMGEASAAAFALAFFSPGAANALLAEKYACGGLSRRELVLSNLFNSSPAFLVHLPTTAAMVFSFLGWNGFYYVGISFAGASLRTLGTALCGRWLLPPPEPSTTRERRREGFYWPAVARKVLRSFIKRFRKVLLFTVPIYILFFALRHVGVFAAIEQFLADHVGVLSFLKPEALGIVVLCLAAELGAALSAAAAVSVSLSSADIIMALLVGNILSSPIRAIRHQFPSYAGYYAPAMAATLVLVNQSARVLSLGLLTALFYVAAF